MESLFLLIPLSILVVLIVSLMGFWASRSRQYDDLDEDGHAALENEAVIADNEETKPSTEKGDRPTDPV